MLKPFKENAWTNSNRKSRALKKIEVECNVSDDIKNAFENYFEKSKENKMDLFDFYKVMEKCEVDVEASSNTLFDQHFKSRLTRLLFLGLCRKKRTMEAQKHVVTFDQIEAEKHQYQAKSKLSEQDSLSKVILVYLSVIQFVDLGTDASLLSQMYKYSYIKYTECSPSRIDWNDELQDCYIIP